MEKADPDSKVGHETGQDAHARDQRVPWPSARVAGAQFT
jgi:hypothetical protein